MYLRRSGSNSTRLLLLQTLICTTLLYAVAARKLPVAIKPCAKDDPDLETCAIRSANAAIPVLTQGDPAHGIAPSDPLYVPEFSIDDTGNTGQVALNLNIKDMYITGLAKHIINKMNLDLESGAISWSGIIPRLELVGDYKATGRVLILPLSGNGAMNFTLEDVKFTYSMRLQEGKTKTGRSAASVGDNHLVFEPTRCYIKLDNLLGDPVLSARMNEFLNENWKPLVDELGPPIGEVLNQATLRTIQAVTRNVPLNEIFPTSSS